MLSRSLFWRRVQGLDFGQLGKILEVLIKTIETETSLQNRTKALALKFRRPQQGASSQNKSQNFQKPKKMEREIKATLLAKIVEKDDIILIKHPITTRIKIKIREITGTFSEGTFEGKIFIVQTVPEGTTVETIPAMMKDIKIINKMVIKILKRH